MDSLRVIINGDSWSAFLLEEDDFAKRFGTDTAAFCDNKAKQMFFAEDEFDIATVRHELLHAYFHYQYVGSAALDNDQMEEVFCELFASEAPKILRQASFIHKKLKT